MFMPGESKERNIEMRSIFVSERKTLKVRTLVTVFGIAMCVLLPQLFHLIGAASGLGASVGAAFMPMYLPALFVGLFSGSIPGIICGIASPFISFALTGMPVPVLIPIMAAELAVFGGAAGVLSERKMPWTVKVLVSQLLGRGMRMLFAVVSVYLLGAGETMLSQTAELLLSGLPGIALQLCVLPLIMRGLENLKND